MVKRKGLATKTIKQHVSNADFYINDYLNYYETIEMENGYYEIDSFLGTWFIHKCI
ncbi:MAG: hypothetical protein IJ509_03900 [Bacilli bacterium]|nr:hypothetical protein [Bacilli bacterium]